MWHSCQFCSSLAPHLVHWEDLVQTKEFCRKIADSPLAWSTSTNLNPVAQIVDRSKEGIVLLRGLYLLSCSWGFLLVIILSLVEIIHFSSLQKDKNNTAHHQSTSISFFLLLALKDVSKDWWLNTTSTSYSTSPVFLLVLVLILLLQCNSGLIENPDCVRA